MKRIGRIAGLATSVVAVGCVGLPPDPDRSADPKCGLRGSPVTIAKLVEVFREHGITLDVDRRKCERPDSTSPDATNAGPSGLQNDEEIERREGFVLCHVGSGGGGRKVRVVKYPIDMETHLDGLNVSCAVYPYDASSERAQVARVEAALRDLVGQTPADEPGEGSRSSYV